MRGEYFLWVRVGCCAEGSPPHARGISHIAALDSRVKGLTPACAGNILETVGLRKTAWAHPRMRGEYVIVKVDALIEEGSPPHARGILRRHSRNLLMLGLTPACAGNILSAISSTSF